MPSILEEKIWAGSHASYDAVLRAEELQVAMLEAGHQQPDEAPAPRLLEVRDGIGYVTIHGPLRNSADANWNEWLGVTGYPEIRDAMIAAAGDASIKHIVLDINSGGGSVSGVDDTSKLIRTISDKVKPVTAFTDGSMFSAAYWLGSSASDVYMSKGAGVGSIGVIATHMEQSQRLKDEGIGATVVRAGRYKALANGVEKLTEEGKAQIQAAVDAGYEIFIDHVSEMRGKSTDYVDQVMAQGREFYGQAAADASLVDDILTFDALVERISAKLIDQSNSFMDNRAKQKAGATLRVEVTGDANMAKKTLTEAEIAALAAGVPPEAAASQGTADAESAATNEGAGEGATESATADAGAPDESAVAAQNHAKEVVAIDGTLKFVSDQLAAANSDLLATKLALSKLEDKHAEMSALVDPLKSIAAKAVNNMRVALGGSAISAEGCSAAQVLADYAAVSESFTKRYPVGGVAAVSQAQSEQTKKKSASPVHLARVNAARHSK